MKKLLWLIPFFGLIVFVGCVGNEPPSTPNPPSGPSSACVGDTVGFSAYAYEYDDEDVAFTFDWGDGHSSPWSNYVSLPWRVSMSHVYSRKGTFEVRVKAKDIEDNETDWSSPSSIDIPNSRPIISTPSGPTSGVIGESYWFSTSATDPDGDSVVLRFDYGNSHKSIGRKVASGESWSALYGYRISGTFNVTARAIDVHDASSGWSDGHSIEISE